MTAILAHMVWP